MFRQGNSQNLSSVTDEHLIFWLNSCHLVPKVLARNPISFTSCLIPLCSPKWWVDFSDVNCDTAHMKRFCARWRAASNHVPPWWLIYLTSLTGTTCGNISELVRRISGSNKLPSVPAFLDFPHFLPNLVTCKFLPTNQLSPSATNHTGWRLTSAYAETHVSQLHLFKLLLTLPHWVA